MVEKEVVINYRTIKGRRLKLREWLYRARITVKEFSDMVEVNRSYIHLIMSGAKTPSQKLMDRIKEVTKGKVCRMKDLKDEEPKKED